MLRHRFNWKRVSAAATLCYRSDRKRARLYFHTHPGAYNNESLIEFILELRCHFRGDKVPSSGTDFPPQRSRHMARVPGHPAALAGGRKTSGIRARTQPRGRPVVEPQGHRTGQPSDETIDATVRAAAAGVQRVKSQQQLLFAFLRPTGLSL